MDIQQIHHVAIICADYARSKAFYTQVLGLRVLDEVYRPERRSYKLDLAVGNRYQIELFSFPSPPPRVDQPEAAGLRHLAFAIFDLDAAVAELRGQGVAVEAIRVDGLTGRRFTFIHDPDGLPLEFYEASEP